MSNKRKQLKLKKRKITERQELPIQQHSNIIQSTYPNKKYGNITLPILEMSDPYYPYSHLASSTFHGYYILFFMFSVIFTVVYPVLNILKGEDLFRKTILKLVETNLLWDLISAFLFIFLALIFTQMSILQPPKSMVLVAAGVIFVGGPCLIIKNYQMYFTDRIFIIVLGGSVGAKAISYIFDKTAPVHNSQKSSWTIEQKSKKIGTLSKRLLFFISPIIIYHRFVQEHDPTLKIHIRYIFTKFIVSILCICANNILMVKFIEPACQQTDLFFLALIFKLVPLTFYINMILYYMVFDNVLAAVAQMTQIKNRVFYLDWWNAKTIHQFLQKWCLLLVQFSNIVIPKANSKVKNTVNVLILILLLLIIFGKNLNPLSLVLFLFILLSVYFLGGNPMLQNNYIVHILCMGFTPFMIGLHVKYRIFE